MFGLFGKKTSYHPSVTPKDQAWVEDMMIQLIIWLGIAPSRQPFLTPTSENFPYDNLHAPDQFEQLFEQLCAIWDLDSGEIVVKIFDDVDQQQWSTWTPHQDNKRVLGRYYESSLLEEKPFYVEVALSNFSDTQRLIAVLAHELAHVKLLGGGYIDEQHPELEPLTDLASIFMGFGIFHANVFMTMNMGSISRMGYLANEIISYANALLCYITQDTPDTYTPFLNRNTHTLFINNFKFLAHTNDTRISFDVVEHSMKIYDAYQQLNRAYENNDPVEIIAACQQVIQVDPKNENGYNNLGHALLQQKDYEEAILHFSQAIALDPHFDYAYNNRGYCKRQLKDLENALVDIQCAMDINPNNAYCWRNMGAYHLANQAPEEALKHFKEAEKIDPHTELINFYLGQAYLQLNDPEQAQKYLDQSAALPEHNDSTIA